MRHDNQLGATRLAAAGLTGLLASYVYQHAGRFAVCAGTAAVMTIFLVASPPPRSAAINAARWLRSPY